MLNIFKKSARILLAGYPIVLPISVLVVKLSTLRSDAQAKWEVFGHFIEANW